MKLGGVPLISLLIIKDPTPPLTYLQARPSSPLIKSINSSQNVKSFHHLPMSPNYFLYIHESCSIRFHCEWPVHNNCVAIWECRENCGFDCFVWSLRIYIIVLLSVHVRIHTFTQPPCPIPLCIFSPELWTLSHELISHHRLLKVNFKKQDLTPFVLLSWC